MENWSLRRLVGQAMALTLIGLLVACTATPSTSGTPAPSIPLPTPTTGAMSPSPTATPIGSVAPWPTPPAESFAHADQGWWMVGSELDDLTSALVRHWLFAGTLDSARPRLAVPLLESPWEFNLFADQEPVVGGPVRGRVLYVADDGTQSTLRLANVDGTLDTSAGETDAIVFDAILAPGGEAAYLALLDRATGRDLGVYRLALDSALLERVMEPAPRDLAAAGRVTLAAVRRFVRHLVITPDGRQLVRFACGEPYGTCLVQVLTVESGNVLTVDGPITIDFLGLADDVLVGRWGCGLATCTGIEVWNLETGVRKDLGEEWTATAINGGGGLLLLRTVGGNYGDPPGAELWGYDVATGSTQLLSAGEDGYVIGANVLIPGGVELPWGWALMANPGIAALNLSNGTVVPLALPPELPDLGGGHD